MAILYDVPHGSYHWPSDALMPEREVLRFAQDDNSIGTAGSVCDSSSSRLLKRSRRYSTIRSTIAACERGKIKTYLAPLPAAGKTIRFSERNFGSCATIEPSSSIVCANGRPFLRATKWSLRGSSFVASSAPNRFAGMRRPRPLRHGAAHAIVSPRTFCRLTTDASRDGSASGNCAEALRSAGPFNFLKASQIFAFIPRKIFGAK